MTDQLIIRTDSSPNEHMDSSQNAYKDDSKIEAFVKEADSVKSDSESPLENESHDECTSHSGSSSVSVDNEYKKQLEECMLNIRNLQDENTKLGERFIEVQSHLEMTLKQRDNAVKEKDSMVMKYAVSEKTVLDLKMQKEQIEKNQKESLRENEFLQHKVTVMASEKSRICQMLDNKCYELKSSQQKLEHIKADINTLETKLKWTQTNLSAEMETRKEYETKLDDFTIKLKEATEQIEGTKREAQENINYFQHSQENRAYVLDQELKEVQASLILLRHERDDRDNQVNNLQIEMGRLQIKQNENLQENNSLSLKIQQLERERLDTCQKLSELRGCADQQRQDAAELMAKTAQLEQLKLQIQNEKERLLACNKQMLCLKQRNAELESDMEICRAKEAELLVFTQQLTDKNVRLQSEFTAMETKVQQLTCEQTLLKRNLKEHETKANLLLAQFTEEQKKHTEEITKLSTNLADKTKLCELLTQEVADQKGENLVIKRKFDLSLKEVNKELQQSRKKIEYYENASTSSNSSNTSLNTIDHSTNASMMLPSSEVEKVKVVPSETTINKQTLIEHIIKLQRVSARKSEKIDFLEEHISTLVAELQRKTRLLQSYIMREESGTLSSNKMDNSKENVDTLGTEIERLNKLLKSASPALQD